MRKLDKVSARLSFSPKYGKAVAENAIKSLVLMYHEAICIFLGSKKCPEFSIFLGFLKM